MAFPDEAHHRTRFVEIARPDCQGRQRDGLVIKGLRDRAHDCGLRQESGDLLGKVGLKIVNASQARKQRRVGRRGHPYGNGQTARGAPRVHLQTAPGRGLSHQPHKP